MSEEIYTVISEGNLKVLLNVAWASPRGKIVEIGVYKGGSAYLLNETIAKPRGLELHLFDTFTGIPERSDIDHHEIGDFNDVNLEDVKRLIPDAHFHVGFFPRTLPDDLTGIGFAHVDCDQYQSVKEACIRLKDRMVPGGIIYFDDFGVLEGATQAVNEIFPYRIVLENRKAMVIIWPER